MTTPITVFRGMRRNTSQVSAGSVPYFLEELELKGYAVFPNFFSQAEGKAAIADIDALHAADEKKWGADELAKINDFGVVRNPFLESRPVLELCFSTNVLDLCEAIFQEQFILHVNRAVINEPGPLHPASAWHREPPYQNFTTSQPLALTFTHILDPSTVETGGLHLLPGSHRWETFPSDEYVRHNVLKTNIDAGSLLVFNSALFHCNSENKTKKRRSLVTIFTSPLIKQQTRITQMLLKNPTALANIKNIRRSSFLFGFDTDPLDSDDDYRNYKLERNLKIY